MNAISRRAFLGAGAAVAAWSVLPSRAYGANERIRVGVIGLRNRGPQVAEAMIESGHFEIAALSDCDTAMFQQALAREELAGVVPPTIKQEQDFRRLLEDPDIDAVIVATPDHWHAAMTLLALDAGKHVYVEKPATYCIDEGKWMRDAAKRHDKLTVAMGTQQRSGPHFAEARQFIQEGNLGHVGFVRLWITHVRERLEIVPDSAPPETLDYEMWVGPAPMQPYNEQKCHYNWHFVKAYGTGEMGNWGAHWIDIARWYLDLDWPERVIGSGGTYVVKDAKETPDTLTAIYEYPDRTMVWEQRLWTKNKVNGDGSGAEFIGEKGTMVVTRGGWTFTPGDAKPERKPGSELMIPHVTNFAESIRGQAQPVANMEEGHKTAAFCHMANLTVELGRPLKWDGAEERFVDDDEANAGMSRPYRAPWDAVRTA